MRMKIKRSINTNISGMKIIEKYDNNRNFLYNDSDRNHLNQEDKGKRKETEIEKERDILSQLEVNIIHTFIYNCLLFRLKTFGFFNY